MSRILRVLPLVLFASTSLLAAAEIQWGGQVGAHRFHPESEILILDGIPRNAHQAQIKETVIRKRFEEYDRESRPVLDFYAPELNPQN